jgi:hypothetical protein
MSQPKRLIVAYDDGSTREAEFSRLDGQLLLKLAQMGLCPPLEHVGASKHYLLVRWEDGWQEVFAVDADSAELLRYFVIERIEDRGRLSVDVGAEYPELFVLERTPKGVVEALIIGAEGVRSYGLESQLERWEGIFEDGGKKEFIKYDKTGDSYPHASSEKSDALAKMLADLRSALERKGLSTKELLSREEPAKIAEYRELAGSLGIRGGRRQQDVYGLIDLLLREEGGTEA